MGDTPARDPEPRSFVYAGQEVDVLTAATGDLGVAVTRMAIPAGFRGPVPHVHRGFDEAMVVLDGRILLVLDDHDPVEVGAGRACQAPRGVRHTFSNPDDSPAVVLGIWTPGARGLAFMRDVGAVIPAEGAPDPAAVAALYAAHDSVLMP